MRSSFVLVAAVAFVCVAAACSIAPVDPAGRACDDKHTCAGGFACVDGACETSCTSSAQCPAGRACVGGGCAVVVTPDGGVAGGEGEGASEGEGEGGAEGEGAGEGEGEGVVVDPNAPTIVAPDPNVPQAQSHGESVDVALHGDDADVGDVVTFVVVAQPEHGTAVGTSTGVTYTPAQGFAGFDSIGVAATDGTLRSGVVDVAVYTVGKSCAHILTVGGARGDGKYTIDPTLFDVVTPDAGPAAGPSDIDVFCDMTDNGGGFTLALKVDGSQPTFCHDKAIWTDDTTLSPDSIDTTHVEAKLAPYTSVDATEVLLQMTDETALVDDALVIPLNTQTAEPLRDIIAGATTTTTLPPSAFASLVPAGALRNGVHTLDVAGTNVVKSNGQQVRIGALGVNNDCGPQENTVGVGIRSGSCGGDFTVNAGFRGDNGCTNIEDASFALVSVRSRDFTFLPPIASCNASPTSPILSGEYEVDADGPGGASPQPVSCNFGDFHGLVDFDFARGDACPSPLVATAGGCVRDPVAHPAGGPVSIDLPSPVAYSAVKIVVQATSIGSLTGFTPSTVNGASLTGLYVDGVSVTSSPTSSDPPQHVFTFAAGAAGFCPCDTGSNAKQAPGFVGSNFLCDESNPLFDFNSQGPPSSCVSNADTTELVPVTPGSTGDVVVTIETQAAPADADIVLTKLQVLVR